MATLDVDEYVSYDQLQAAMDDIRGAPDKGQMNTKISEWTMGFVLRQGKRLYASLAYNLMAIMNHITMRGVSQMSFQEIAQFEDNVGLVNVFTPRNGDHGRFGISELMTSRHNMKRMKSAFKLQGRLNLPVSYWAMN